MTVLLIWVLKSETNSYCLPVTTTSTFLHPALRGNDENQDLRIIFFPAMHFVLIKMPLKKLVNVHKCTKHDKRKTTLLLLQNKLLGAQIVLWQVTNFL